MKRRSLLKFFALSTGNIALPLPLFNLDGTLKSKPTPQTKATVTAKRAEELPGIAEFTFLVDKNISYSPFHLDSPNRFVIDFVNAGIYGIDNLKKFKNSLILKVRVGHPTEDNVRVVFDLSEPIHMDTAIFSKNSNSYLKVRITAKTTAHLLSTTTKKEILVEDLEIKEKQKKIVASQPKKVVTANNKPDRIIVIDPGHGGIDPGTIGAGGTKEKDVVLAVAKKVQERLNKIDGYQAYLTRYGDHFLNLKKRVAIMQEHKADLSISLHVDAYHDPSINGAAVYCLNENSELPIDPLIKMLMEKENSVRWANNIGFVGPINRSSDWSQLASIRKETLYNARIFGKNLIKSMESSHKINLQYNRVKRADFFILKTPATPSALVEMGFLSNPNDEQKIKDETYQDHISLALTQGVSRYLSNA
ncbi:MAG: N-acetylmuramoyl-L-alanine amidase [Magnetococcales bacterium]|nr:N-acetylmuramoyl-L-alanine amidase [Magnetococcales bacterium]